MPAGFFETASWTAVAISVGLVWSSRTTPLILWPSMPPSAFCSAIRALKPAGALLNSDEPSPVSEVIMTRVMGEPDAAAPATPPPARLVMPTPAVKRERRQPQPAPVPAGRYSPCCFLPKKCHPMPNSGT